MLRKLIASTAIALSATAVVPGVVQAAEARGRTVEYQLTPRERSNACGNFGGTIIFSDGSSLDCSTGVATLPVAE